MLDAKTPFFQKPESKKRPLILLPQGFTARWTLDSSCRGVFTENISTCYIFLIKGMVKGKLHVSLTHADPSITKDMIERELRWAGEKSSVTLIRHAATVDHPLEESLKSIIKKSEKMWLPADKNALTITMPNLTINFLNTEDEAFSCPPLALHPQQLQITYKHLLNLNLTDIYAAIDEATPKSSKENKEGVDKYIRKHSIIYNKDHFEDLSGMELTATVKFNFLRLKEIIEKALKSQSKKIDFIYSVFSEYFRGLFQFHGIKFYPDPETEKNELGRMVTLFVECYCNLTGKTQLLKENPEAGLILFKRAVRCMPDQEKDRKDTALSSLVKLPLKKLPELAVIFSCSYLSEEESTSNKNLFGVALALALMMLPSMAIVDKPILNRLPRIVAYKARCSFNSPPGSAGGSARK